MLHHAANQEVSRIDGRILRGIRTRQAIITSLRDVLSTADNEPTLRDISERAGVSQRIVLKYYGDVAGLIAALLDHVRSELVSRYATMPGALSLDDRIASYVDLRVELCERFAPAWLRAVQMTRHTSEMNRLVNRGYADLRELAGNVFAGDLRCAPYALQRDLLDQLAMLVDAYNWRYLRHTCGRSPEEAKAMMRTTIRRVVAL